MASGQWPVKSSQAVHPGSGSSSGQSSQVKHSILIVVVVVVVLVAVAVAMAVVVVNQAKQRFVFGGHGVFSLFESFELQCNQICCVSRSIKSRDS